MCFLRKSARLVISTADRRIRFYDLHTWEQVDSKPKHVHLLTSHART